MKNVRTLSLTCRLMIIWAIIVALLLVSMALTQEAGHIIPTEGAVLVTGGDCL